MALNVVSMVIKINRVLLIGCVAYLLSRVVDGLIRGDDLLGRENHQRFSVLPNGNAIHLNFVIRKNRNCTDHHSSHSDEGIKDSISGISTAADAIPKKRSSTAPHHVKQPSSTGVMAVFTFGRPHLPNGAITDTFKKRLVHAVRMALLTGAPWIIVPCSRGERTNSEAFLRNMGSPGDLLFNDAVVEDLPPELQELAKQLRDSMRFAASLDEWIQSGNPIEHFARVANVEGTGVSIASPRLLRHGQSQWIIPEFVWVDRNESWVVNTKEDIKHGLLVLLRRVLQIDFYGENSESQSKQDADAAWLERGIFDIIVVGSMHNEGFLYSATSRELSFLSRAHRQSTVLQRQGRENLLVSWLSKNINVRITSAEDSVPEITVPEPWIVDAQPEPRALRKAWWLFRMLAPLSHTIHLNYCRWSACIRCSLTSVRIINFVFEFFAAIEAILTEKVNMLGYF
ncbi:uncharacterized protein TEOVI_000492000 [Trypanosoma equiperdum]|uniref:Uncharacterized protein n=2 Tax=Trypanozoon TaxID=39700 RepID=Q385Q7_TRYB2|nr:hypothetical protein, conserved [Trypanosoma brucei brucei TREU927]EAN79474.1 hypothetical protein, conserved [Trypanosoma brucei brucei TREU927]SCU66400.1 hypothetical protein, conserved [Trypanosoma equiperdum]